MQQKISYWSCLFEIFFIASTHLQRLKFLKNAWDGVKLLHFNKTIFSIKTFIKGVYLLQILLKEFLNRIWKGYFLAHLSVVAFDNINFEFILNQLIIEWKKQKFLQRWFIVGKFWWSIWTRLPSGSSDQRNPPVRNSVSCGKCAGPFERDKQ